LSAEIKELDTLPSGKRQQTIQFMGLAGDSYQLHDDE
jgi:hypothetical protein